MNCSDFQAQLDFYLDEELDELEGAQAARHIGICPTCERDVAEHKQARSLLKAAVAEQAAAVDVSGLWSAIEAGLDSTDTSSVTAPNVLPIAGWRSRHATSSTHTHDVFAGSAPARSAKSAKSGTFRRPAERPMLSTFGRLQKGALATAAAAAVFAIAILTTDILPTSQDGDIRPRTFAQSRPVRIDAMEVGAGHSVSTWVKPRSKTRVIWLANTGSGMSVTPVSHSR